jgi:sarcosine oxidase
MTEVGAGGRRDWDAIVIGLGAIGSAATYWLSTRLGDRVLGLEQFELGHPNGASQDHSRIIRYSYHRPDYVRLARRAYASWAEVEAESGERVVTVTGGLDLWPRDAFYPMDDYTGSLTAERIAFDVLDADEVRRRWPQWQLDDDTIALFQADSGLADPIRGNRAHRDLARRRGATLLEQTPVTGLRDVGGNELEITTADGGTYRTPRVVIAADAWTNELLAGFDRRLPLTVTKEQVTYFAARTRRPSRRTGSPSGSGRTNRASTASRPTGRPAPRLPRMSAARSSRPRREPSSVTMQRSDALRSSWSITCPTHSGRRS